MPRDVKFIHRFSVSDRVRLLTEIVASFEGVDHEELESANVELQKLLDRLTPSIAVEDDFFIGGSTSDLTDQPIEAEEFGAGADFESQEINTPRKDPPG
ncbi:MAG: hypothetical protein ACYSW8_32750 [Planctomycetota bacterium]|jgi:hypothetical protein